MAAGGIVVLVHALDKEVMVGEVVLVWGLTVMVAAAAPCLALSVTVMMLMVWTAKDKADWHALVPLPHNWSSAR